MSKKAQNSSIHRDTDSFNAAFELLGMQQGKHNPESIPSILHQQHHNTLPTANYTLPGVISYLTSEFTHLERFKITTNLEKSEMKYKILQLTSEVNSLRFINDKQALKIKELEAKLQMNGLLPVKEISDIDIPQVDLDILQQSRAQLNKLIRDVVRVLKPPLAISRNYLNAHSTLQGTDFDELLDDSEKFLFENESQNEKIGDSIFAKYMNDSNEESILLGNLEEDAERLVDLVQKDLAEQNSQNAPSRRPPPQDEIDTDTETVIVDEAEEALAQPKQSISFGQETRLLARNCSSFEPFNDLLVLLEGSQFTVLRQNNPILKGDLGDVSGSVVSIFYLGKKRVLLITLKGVSLHTYKDDMPPSTKSLIKEEKVLIETCDIAESAHTSGGKNYYLTLSGMGKDGKLVISAHEIKAGHKVTSRLLGNFNSSFLKASEKVKDVKWAPRDDAMHENDPDELPYDLIVLHEKIQRLKVNEKTLIDIKAEADYHGISVHNNLLLIILQEGVEVYDLDQKRIVGALPRHKHATYVLLKIRGNFVAEVLDQVVLYDLEMLEVLRHASPILNPRKVYGIESEKEFSLVIQGNDGISIIPMEAN